MKVFVSHTKRDSKALEFTRRLVKFLSKNGIEVVFDEAIFRPGHSIIQEIIDGIYASNKFILISSSNSFESNYVNAELKFARERQVELYPEVFIHLVNLQGKRSPTQIPKDLRGSLYHDIKDVSENRLMFDILFGLHGFRIDKLVLNDIQFNPNSDWVILSRHDIVKINNLKGDSAFEHHMALLNASERDEVYTHTMNMWVTDGDIKKPPIAIFPIDNEVESEDVVNEEYRGRPTLRYKVKFKKPILPNDVLRFHYELKIPVAFDMKGDFYEFEFEHKNCGRYRLDIFFPKTITKLDSKVIHYKGNEKISETEPDQMGHNIRSFQLFDVTAGGKCILEFKTSSNNV